MLTQLLGIRAEERRDLAVGFVTLMAIMTGHSMLETARDTLFPGEARRTLRPKAREAAVAGSFPSI